MPRTREIINRNYERKEKITSVKVVVYFDIEGMKRRLQWRARELGTSIRKICIENNLDRRYFFRMMKRDAVPILFFAKLTKMFRMDEVNGWLRPFPKITPKEDRVRLADIREEEINKMVSDVLGDDFSIFTTSEKTEINKKKGKKKKNETKI
jgi:hypothetical protein